MDDRSLKSTIGFKTWILLRQIMRAENHLKIFCHRLLTFYRLVFTRHNPAILMAEFSLRKRQNRIVRHVPAEKNLR